MPTATAAQIAAARDKLDAQVREIVRWHFSPDTGTPFWLEKAKSLKFNPLKDVKGFDDLKLFGLFEDEWLRGGPVRRWVPEGAARTSRSTSSRPAAPPASPRAASSSTTSASTTRCSATRCRTSSSPRGRNWLMLGPSGPRRLRLAVEHLCPVPRRHLLLHRPRPALGGQAHQEGLDGAPEGVPGALHRPGDDDPVGRARHQVHVHDAEAARRPVRAAGEGGHRASPRPGITGIFCGGTEMTSQWIRFAIEEYLGAGRVHRADLRQHADGPGGGRDADGGGRTTRSPTTPRSRGPWPQVVDFDDYDKVVDYGQTGRVLLTTLTKEFFVPRFAGARRGRARAAVARSTRGTASAACGRSTSSRRRRRWGYTEAMMTNVRRLRSIPSRLPVDSEERSGLGRLYRRRPRQNGVAKFM